MVAAFSAWCGVYNWYRFLSWFKYSYSEKWNSCFNTFSSRSNLEHIFVYDALAKMSVDHPDKGFISFLCQKSVLGDGQALAMDGYILISEVLIMGSQLIALGLFTQYSCLDFPLWIVTSIYGVFGLLVILTGMNGFEKIKNLFGVVKTAAIVMCIFVAIFLLFKGIGWRTEQRKCRTKLWWFFFGRN